LAIGRLPFSTAQSGEVYLSRLSWLVPHRYQRLHNRDA
jgi:hypothetical protein